jgi:hypothetical protein
VLGGGDDEDGRKSQLGVFAEKYTRLEDLPPRVLQDTGGQRPDPKKEDVGATRWSSFFECSSAWSSVDTATLTGVRALSVRFWISCPAPSSLLRTQPARSSRPGRWRYDFHLPTDPA